MHKLNRYIVQVPECLVKPTRSYKQLYRDEIAQIREALLTMQNHRCAYCERRTGDERDDGHIEHFRDQYEHQHLSCDWTNLYWSCNDEKTCGKHKDKCRREGGRLKKFQREDIIDPGVDDPEQYLLFLSDGTVQPQNGLSDDAQRRAEETLRVFQLNESPLLRKSRQDAISPYINLIDKLMRSHPDIVVAYIQSELDEVAAKPFATAIKMFLESIVSPCHIIPSPQKS